MSSQPRCVPDRDCGLSPVASDDRQMIRSKTVFVVGAGASVDFGFPLGDALSKQIAAALKFRPDSNQDSAREFVRSAVTNLHQKPGQFRGRGEELFKKAWQMHEGLATVPSIDVFI